MVLDKESLNFVWLATACDTATQVLIEKIKNLLQKTKDTKTLEKFVGANQHKIYHHCIDKHASCCQCTGEFIIPKNRNMNMQYWRKLFESKGAQKNCGESNFCCCQFQTKSCNEMNEFDLSFVCSFLETLFYSDKNDPELQQILKLRKERNTVFHGGAKVAEGEFQRCWTVIDYNIKCIASSCGVLGHFSKELREIRAVPDYNQLLQQVLKINERLTEYFEMCPSTEDTTDAAKNQLKENIKSLLDSLRQMEIEENKYPAGIKTLIQNTKLRLKSNMTDLFIELPTVKKGIETLKDRNALLILGKAGSGKTSHAFKFLREMYFDEDYLPICLTVPDDVRMINGNEKAVIFVDDIFGKSNFDKAKFRNWEIYFESLHNFTKHGKIKVIITMRDNVFTECEPNISVSALFKKENRISLSLSQLERKEIFLGFCKHHNISVMDLSRSELTTSKDSFKTKVPEHALSTHDVHELTAFNPLMGFPQACFLYFSEKKFRTLDCVNFYRQPQESLVKDIDDLRKSRDESDRISYCFLVLLLANNGKYDTRLITKSELVPVLMRSLPVPSLMQELFVTSVVDIYLDPYVVERYDSKKCYEFKHQSVLEATFLSFVKWLPSVAIEYCSLNLLKDYVRPQNYQKCSVETAVPLDTSSYQCIIQRVLLEFSQCTKKPSIMRMIVSLPMFSDKEFALQFVNELKVGIASEESSTSLDLASMFLSEMCDQGRSVILHIFLENFTISPFQLDIESKNQFCISREQLRECLSRLIFKGHVDAAKVVIEADGQLADESSHSSLSPLLEAALKGEVEIFQYLQQYAMDKQYSLFESPFLTTDNSNRHIVHFLSLQGWITDIRELRHKEPTIIHLKDVMKWTILHYAAYGGQYSLIEEFVEYGLSINDKSKEGFSVVQAAIIALDYQKRIEVFKSSKQSLDFLLIDSDNFAWNSDYYRFILKCTKQSNFNPLDFNIVRSVSNWYTLLDFMALDNNLILVDFLLNHCCSIFNVVRKESDLPTAFHIASFLGRYQFLKRLQDFTREIASKDDTLLKAAMEGSMCAEETKFLNRKCFLDDNSTQRMKIMGGHELPITLFSSREDFDKTLNLLKTISAKKP